MAKKQEQITTIEDLLVAAEPKQIIETLTFENALSLLEQLVLAVEKGQLSLDSSIQSYERGMVLVDHLRTVLNKAEAKLKIIKE